MYLGVDGGGSKSAFLLIDKDGRTLARHKSTGSYHLQIGMEGLSSLMSKGIAQILKKAQIQLNDIDYAFFGLPAYGEDSRVQSALDILPKTIMGSVPYACGNDMVCGWAGSLGCKDGINIVAGTGSIAYGEAGGQAARSGGWGELFSDEGSAYWVAVRGLNAFSKMSDGRLPAGPLLEVYRKAFTLKADLDLSGLVMSEIAPSRDAVAALAKHVTRAAQLGDAHAAGIFKQAGQELASIIAVIGRTLAFNQEAPIDVSYSGGIFASGDLILAPLKAALSCEPQAYRLIPPVYTPDVGAALYAAKLADATITPI